MLQRWEFIKENKEVRKQERDQEKRSRKQELDQKSDQEKKKKTCFDHFLGLVFLLSCFLL